MIRDGDPISKLLDAKARLRSNWKNDGRAFQKSIAATASAYANTMTARLAKVDPPNFIVGTAQNRRVIFKANPFLDFIGVWTARGGRALMVEAKSTATHRLPLNRPGGVTTEQLTTILVWRGSGAAVVLLWMWADRVVLFTPEMLRAASLRGDKSVLHEDGVPVPRGVGSVIWDFLPVLEKSIWG